MILLTVNMKTLFIFCDLIILFNCIQSVYNHGNHHHDDHDHNHVKGLISSPSPLPSTPSTPSPKSSSSSQSLIADHLDPKVFTYSQNDSFLQINSTDCWPPHITRSLNFKFKTDRSNGLLLFHTINSGPVGYPLYEFHIILSKGAIEIIHEFGLSLDRFTIGKGFNDDLWHYVNLTINTSENKLKVIVDGQIGSIFVLTSFGSLYPKGYQPYGEYNPSQPSAIGNIPSTLYFGGLDLSRRYVHKHHNSPRFIGCLGSIQFTHSSILFVDIPPITTVGLKVGCNNLCRTNDLCSMGSVCVNHYTHSSCDCFGTEYEDKWCTITPVTSLTFRGTSFITYTAFNWTERTETLMNRISLHFQSRFENSMLLYAYGLYPDFNHVFLDLINGQLRFEIDFGEGPLRLTTSGGEKLSDGEWHNVTVIHVKRDVDIYVDGVVHRLRVSGQRYYLHLEPYIYVAGLPKSIEVRSLYPASLVRSKFIGSLKSVYFNQENILFGLKKGRHNIRYTGLFGPEYGSAVVQSLPITFQTSRSYLNVTKRFSNILDLFLEFKTPQRDVILSSGGFRFVDEPSVQFLWILHLKDSIPQFSILDDNYAEVEPISRTWSSGKPVRFLTDQWQMIGLYGQSSNLTIEVNNVYSVKYQFEGEMSFNGHIIVGALNATFNNSKAFGYGIMGCIRNLGVDHQTVDSRILLNNRQLHSGRVALDQCSYINACDYPGACEHGGKCTVNKEGDADCDCTETGYAGKTCHFALYKRTCEEYYLIGHRKNGTYMIDIDRNGPLPPARVECTMSLKRTETTVIHNLPVEYIVRRKDFPSYYIDIDYREFNKEMLKALISHTKGCNQEIKYGCKKAPFNLAKETWMISASDRRVDSLGSTISGHCSCSTGMTCSNRSSPCNCDSLDERENEDSGVIMEPSKLAITRVFFTSTINLTDSSEGRFTLSPLKCIDLSTQEHIVTFKTQQSYLELDGWVSGDLAFSFRTTIASGIILYQAPLFPHHGYFLVTLISPFELLFDYSVNGVPKQSKLISRSKLNSGQWQQVWVDYETRHMRFTVNLDSLMIDLDRNEMFDLFEGPLYIGGAPELKLKTKSKEGFIGCFRGLLIADRIIPLSIPERVTDIQPRCQESCQPNPCQNNGHCIEMWGNYECRCANPIAHSGRNCQHDANLKGLTLSSDNAFIHLLVNGNFTHPVLNKQISLSFRTYEGSGLILYANDHLNNFIQLHLFNKSVIFTANNHRTIVSGRVRVGPELISGNLIQLVVDRQPNFTTLSVYTGCERNCSAPLSVGINTTLGLLKEYNQKPWLYGGSMELVRPIRSFIALPPHTQFFIGGVDPIVEHSLTTFIGCISGLIIGSQPFDLEQTIVQSIESQHVNINGNVTSGCQRICDSKPCENGGKCRENMRIGSIEGVECHCEATSYQGNYCDQDIGVRFDGSSVLIYNMTTVDIKPEQGIQLEFAFSAESEAYPFFSQIRRLLLLFQKDEWSLMVGLHSSGGIYLQEFDGYNKAWRKTILRQQHHYADGFRHWVVYNRTGDQVKLEIDSVPYEVTFRQSIPNIGVLKPRQVIKVGGNLDSDEYLNEYNTYIGCVSNLRIRGGPNLNTIISPIESAFEGDDRVDVMQNGSHIWQGIKQQRCSRFKTISKSISNTINIPYELPEVQWSPKEPSKHNIPKNKQRKSPIDLYTTEFYVFVGCLSFLTIVVTAIVIYMCKIQSAHKSKKFKGETPFFNAQRKGSPTIPYTRVYQGFEKRSPEARLISYKSTDGRSKMTELHPLHETQEEYDPDDQCPTERSSNMTDNKGTYSRLED
ncbi:axotactin-like isoform X2 [Panonychus citri]|uniref:axotactin-like isoform X2 n=1 Tax=Panonychus citri TaxID=50023 RepID=UPI0023074955|nr:axotactin-like isoform X2 [Panonychus citri]